MPYRCKTVDVECETQAQANRVDHVHAVWTQAVEQWQTRTERATGTRPEPTLVGFVGLSTAGHLDFAMFGQALADFHDRYLEPEPYALLDQGDMITEHALSTFQATMLEGGIYRPVK